MVALVKGARWRLVRQLDSYPALELGSIATIVGCVVLHSDRDEMVQFTILPPYWRSADMTGYVVTTPSGGQVYFHNLEPVVVMVTQSAFLQAFEELASPMRITHRNVSLEIDGPYAGGTPFTEVVCTVTLVGEGSAVLRLPVRDWQRLNIDGIRLLDFYLALNEFPRWARSGGEVDDTAFSWWPVYEREFWNRLVQAWREKST